MNKQKVDARVQAAIENLQVGRTVEDDAGIEFKGDWPDPMSKARQLAGAANALRGHPLIYVIGVDDKTGAITVPTKTEPQEWYAKVCKPFDQIPPALLGSQTVFVGEDSKSVLAMVFDTTEYPYVINGENRRDVPIRVASGTESAHRSQLVRMFEPSLRAPAMSITEAKVGARWTDRPMPVMDSDPPETARVLSVSLTLRARVLVEHFGTQPTTLPVRDMRTRLVWEGFEARPEVQVEHLGQTPPSLSARPRQQAPPEPVPPQYGVYARDKHVIATAPGEFTISTRFEVKDRRAPDHEMSDLHDLLSSANEMQFDLALRVVGVDRTTKLTARLYRSEEYAEDKAPADAGIQVVSARLGVWELVTADSDPWG